MTLTEGELEAMMTHAPEAFRAFAKRVGTPGVDLLSLSALKGRLLQVAIQVDP